MKKYLLLGLLGVVIVVGCAVMGTTPEKPVDLYARASPACVPTKGTVGTPKRALGVWPLGHDTSIFVALADLRVDWIRSEFLWASIEPARGRFKWDEQDRIVRHARQHKIQILGLLDYSAPWANRQRKEHSPPDDLRDYASFVREVVNRYKPNGAFSKSEGWRDGYGITHWEIWNEPNGKWFWLPYPNTADYVEMLHQANRAIRSVDERAVILHGGLDPGGLGPGTDPKFSPAGFLEDLYARGARDCFDVVNLHTYLFADRPPSDMNNIHIKPVRGVMTRHSDARKPVWVTEFGYTTGRKGWVTEERQAQYLREAYGELLKGNFQALFWFSLGGVPGESYGLLREDLSRKPAYQVYRDRLPL